MDMVRQWAERVQVHMLRWLGKGSGSSWVIAGTLALAGGGAAALNAPAAAAPVPQIQGTIGASSLLAPGGPCYRDPDGDGHIFCDGSVSIASLPASFGQCNQDMDGDAAIFCDGVPR